ncbi:MAG TPA: amidohydrolase family protein [bacterium]|nr:amidohydrolase family protein [bacterium]
MPVDMHNHFYPRPYIERLKQERGIPRVEATPGGEYFVIFPEELRAAQQPPAAVPQGRPFGPAYWDVGEKLAWMDREGIDRIVMSIGNPWVDFLPPTEAVAWARRLNDALLEIREAHPTRIAAMGVLPCGDMEAAVAEVHRIRRAGLCGVILSTRPGGARLDDRRLWPVLGATADTAMPVLIHPHYSLGGDLDGYGHGLPLVYGFIFETTVAATRLIWEAHSRRSPRSRWWPPTWGEPSRMRPAASRPGRRPPTRAPPCCGGRLAST